jgi:hypothetical protein
VREEDLQARLSRRSRKRPPNLVTKVRSPRLVGLRRSFVTIAATPREHLIPRIIAPFLTRMTLPRSWGQAPSIKRRCHEDLLAT